MVKGRPNMGYVAYYADEVYNRGFLSANGKTCIQSYVGTESSPTMPYADSIAASAFAGCSSLTSISIPGSVTGIGDNAFQGCTSLKSVTIEDFESDIVIEAYEALDSVFTVSTKYPTVGRIDSNSPFYGRVHNNTYTEIAPTSTANPKVQFDIDNVRPDVTYDVYVVALPLTVQDASANPVPSKFRATLSYYDENDQKGSFHQTSTLQSNATDIDTIGIGTYTFPVGSKRFEMLVQGYTKASEVRNGTGTLTLLLDCIIFRPQQVAESSLSLGNNYYSNGLFSNCPLESLYVGRNLNNENDAPFARQSSLKEVTLGKDVTSIGDWAFRGCTGLTSIEIPSSVTSIGYCAFNDCYGLTSVEIPSSVTSIGDGAFYLVKNIIYSGNAEGSPWGALTVNGIVDGDFIYSDAEKTQLTAYIGSGGDVVVPSSVTSIGSYAFSGCKGLTSIEIPSSVTSIGNDAFEGCDNIETLRYNTNVVGTIFSNKTSLKTVVIGSSVTSIGGGAFSGCTGLTSITIPSSVTYIGNQAFASCI